MLNQKGLKLDLYSPLNIPEQTNGKFSIRRDIIKKGSKLTIISIRNAILMGVKPLEMILEEDRVIHKLIREGNSLMMSDSPQEIFLLNRGVKNAFGHVLIGGLGLGYIASKIINKPSVKSVMVIEKEKAIIEMVQSYIDKGIKIIHDDLYRYLHSGKAKFDYAYFDIWYGTGERIWLDHVLPLRMLVWGLYGKKKIDCWGEQEMEGQIILALFRIAEMRPELKSISFNPAYYVFAKKIYQLSKDTPKNIIQYFIDKFLTNIGSPKWKKIWNWNKYSRECQRLHENRLRR